MIVAGGNYAENKMQKQDLETSTCIADILMAIAKFVLMLHEAVVETNSRIQFSAAQIYLSIL